MGVNFKMERGYCPYFIYKDTRFFIQDSKDYKNDYVYTLNTVALNPDNELKFYSKDEALNYVREIKGTKLVYNDGSRYLFTNHRRKYIVNGNYVTIWLLPDVLSGTYESYKECLEFSKHYVTNYIKNLSHGQLKLFGGGRQV